MKVLSHVVNDNILYQVGEVTSALIETINNNIDTIVQLLNAIELPDKVSDLDNDANYIGFNDTYINNANNHLTNGYVKVGQYSGSTFTLNLPSVCTGNDRWGVLFFITENAANGTGSQLYFPIAGPYKGRIFTRALVNMKWTPEIGAWELIPLKSDIPTKLSLLQNDSKYLLESSLKTINGKSLIGSGNIIIEGGGDSTLAQSIEQLKLTVVYKEDFNNLIDIAIQSKVNAAVRNKTLYLSADTASVDSTTLTI